MTKILSHCCLGFGFKQNSLKAVEAACKSKVDEIEFDVRIVKNEYILSHDKTKSKKTKLTDVLKYCKKPINVDVKDYGQEQQLLKQLKGKNFTIVSWYPKILNKIHQLNLKVKLSFSHRPWFTKLPNLPLYSVNIPWYMATNRTINKFHDQKIQVNIFTINNRFLFNYFKGKVEMVYSNKPNKLKNGPGGTFKRLRWKGPNASDRI